MADASMALRRAVKQGDHNTVRKLLTDGTIDRETFISESAQQSLLFTAAGRGYAEVAEERSQVAPVLAARHQN